MHGSAAVVGAEPVGVVTSAIVPSHFWIRTVGGA